jgi:hypothetical protein
MKHSDTFYLFVFCLLCKTLSIQGQANSFYVKPIQTNSLYAVSQDSHLVVINPSVTPLNKLLLYIGGTGSTPKNTTYFLHLAAGLGYHVISVAYPNTPSATTSCSNASDSTCYYKFRQEVCYGTPLSTSVSVDSLNSIHGRAYQLLTYLQNTYPSSNWGQFKTGTTLTWSKLLTGGHSQGSGHALYFAKTQSIDRVCMFSGVNDYSDFYNKPGAWLYEPFNTPFSRFFTLLHLNDDIIPFTKQFKNQQAIKMFSGNDDTTRIDNVLPPYQNSHVLYTTAAPQNTISISPIHNSTVIDFWTPLNASNLPKFQAVWTYMLNAPFSVGLKEFLGESNTLTVYPNPVENVLNIKGYTGKPAELKIYNTLGNLVFQQSNYEGSSSIQLPDNLLNGVYFMTLGNNRAKFLKL